jgi:hypothetical protein
LIPSTVCCFLSFRIGIAAKNTDVVDNLELPTLLKGATLVTESGPEGPLFIIPEGGEKAKVIDPYNVPANGGKVRKRGREGWRRRAFWDWCVGGGVGGASGSGADDPSSLPPAACASMIPTMTP